MKSAGHLVTESTRSSVPSEFELRRIGDVEAASWELEALEWSRPDPLPEYFLTVVRARSEVVGPFVLRISVSGNPVTFVGRLEDIPLSSQVGYRTVYAPKVRAITLVHGGAHGVETLEAATALVSRLRTVLSSGDADVVVLPALSVGSALHTAAKAAPGLLRGHLTPTVQHRALCLPETFEDYLRSRPKTVREDIKRLGNRLNREFGDSLEVSVYSRPQEKEALFAAVESVASKTYQRGLGVAFADSEDERSRAELGLERGWFHLYVLSLDGTPIAFWPGFVHGRTFFIGTPGYDPEFARYSVGTFLLMRLIDDLCANPQVDVLDLGTGDSDYKRRFANDSWGEEDVILIAPRPRPVFVNFNRTAIAAGTLVARRVLGRLGFLPRLKRWSRRRLASRGATSPVG